MNDEEIMEALECCGEPYNICAECPMPNNIKDDCRCGEHLANYVLDLINRRQAEIERLKATIDSFTYIGKLYSEIKAEAIKEFAKRLKNEINIRTTYSREQDKNVMRMIDNLVKEIVGEKE